jgi:hypothetical protein
MTGAIKGKNKMNTHTALGQNALYIAKIKEIFGRIWNQSARLKLKRKYIFINVILLTRVVNKLLEVEPDLIHL